MFKELEEQIKDVSTLQKIGIKIKFALYNLMDKLIEQNMSTSLIYQVLILIEFCQMLYFTIYRDFDFLWPSDFTKFLRTVIAYLQFDYLLKDGNETVFLICLYLVFTINILIFLLMIISVSIMISDGKAVQNLCFQYSIKMTSVFAQLFKTIFTIPFFYINFAIIYCDNGNVIQQGFNCYSGAYFAHFSVGMISIFLQALFLILFTVFYIDINPNSSQPFAQVDFKIDFLKLFIKIFLPLYVILDFKMDLQEIFALIVLILYFFLLIQRYISSPFYNTSVYNFTIITEVILFWLTFCVCLHGFFDTNEIDNTGIIYACVGCPITAMLFSYILQRRSQNILQSTDKQLSSEKRVERYIVQLILLVHNCQVPRNQIFMEAVISYHQKNCHDNSDCACKILQQEKFVENEDIKERQTKLYKFVQIILESQIKKFQNSSSLYLIHAYILNQNLNNQFKALYQLSNGEESKPSIQQQFCIFRYRIFIENQLQERDIVTIEQKGMDVNVVIQFQNKYVVFTSEIERCVNLYLEFWRELLDENPDIQKLELLGSRITDSTEIIKDHFQALQQLNPNHMQCLSVYGNFLKSIVSEENESEQILEKIEYVKKTVTLNTQFVDRDKQKYGENSNTCIINISGNKNNLGSVTNANNQIHRLLGYQKEELVEQQSVNRIMPKIYSKMHDKFIEHFLETSEERVMGLERIVMAQNKQGYMVPISLMIKVIPHLREGISFVGFLNNPPESTMMEDIDVHYLMYNTKNSQILGVSQSCNEAFGIPSSIIYGNSVDSSDFSIDQIAPEIDMPNQEELLSPQGLLVTLDTTYIEQNFLIQDNIQSESDDNYDEYLNPNVTNITGNNQTNQNITQQNQQYQNQNQNQSLSQRSNQGEVEQENEVVNKKSKFRKTKIKVHLEAEEEYEDYNTTIRILKFVEVVDGIEDNYNLFGSNMKATQAVSKTTQKTGQMKQTSQGLGRTEGSDGEENQENQDDDEDENEAQNQNSPNGNNGKKDQEDEEQKQLNEDIRILNEFKQMISKKSVPKSIKILQKAVFIVLVAILTLSSVDLILKYNQKGSLQEGVKAIGFAYERHSLLATINLISRYIQLTASKVMPYTTSEEPSDTAVAAKYREKVVENYQEQLSDYVNQLKENEFSVIASALKIEQDIDDNYNKAQIELEYEVSTGDIQKYKYTYSDAIFQYITAAGTLTNSTISQFETDFDFDDGSIIASTDSDSLQNYLYFVKVNGGGILREKSETIAEEIFTYYEDKNISLRNRFIIILILSLTFLTLSMFLLIPIVFSVHKTNNRVLSLFGIISIQEIKQLAVNCEYYIQEYLEEMNDNRENRLRDSSDLNESADQNIIDRSKLNESNIPMMKQKNQLLDISQNVNKTQLNQKISSQQEIDSKNNFNNLNNYADQINSKNNQDQSTNINPLTSQKNTDREFLKQYRENQLQQLQQQFKIQSREDQISLSQKNSQGTNNMKFNGKGDLNNKIKKEFNKAFDQIEEQVKMELQKIEEEEKKYNEDLNGERSENLLNRSDGNKKLVIVIQFIFFVSLLMTYFIVIYILENNFAQKVQNMYTQLKYDSARLPNVKYNVLFTEEDIITTQASSYDDIDDLRSYYYDEVVTNDRFLFQSFNNDFPSAFNSYKSKFEKLNYDNICENTDEISDKSDCEGVLDGILKKGLRTSLVSLIEDTTSLISSYYSDRSSGSDMEEVVIDTINSSDFDEIRQMLKYINLAQEQLKQLNKDSIDKSLNSFTKQNLVAFILFIVFILFLFQFVWVPYLKQLSQKIWRTKGMLNMIPMYVIMKNQRLRNAMKSGEILDAVK